MGEIFSFLVVFYCLGAFLAIGYTIFRWYVFGEKPGESLMPIVLELFAALLISSFYIHSSAGYMAIAYGLSFAVGDIVTTRLIARAFKWRNRVLKRNSARAMYSVERPIPKAEPIDLDWWDEMDVETCTYMVFTHPGGDQWRVMFQIQPLKRGTNIRTVKIGSFGDLRIPSQYWAEPGTDLVAAAQIEIENARIWFKQEGMNVLSHRFVDTSHQWLELVKEYQRSLNRL